MKQLIKSGFGDLQSKTSQGVKKNYKFASVKTTSSLYKARRSHFSLLCVCLCFFNQYSLFYFEQTGMYSMLIYSS